MGGGREVWKEGGVSVGGGCERKEVCVGVWGEGVRGGRTVWEEGEGGGRREDSEVGGRQVWEAGGGYAREREDVREEGVSGGRRV